MKIAAPVVLGFLLAAGVAVAGEAWFSANPTERAIREQTQRFAAIRR